MQYVEISGFFCHLDFASNQFWSFESPKAATWVPTYEFWIFGNFWHCKVWDFSWNQNSKTTKLLKQQFLTFWNHPKLISRKIRVAGILLNFHTVEYPRSKFLNRLLRTVEFAKFSLFHTYLLRRYHFSRNK